MGIDLGTANTLVYVRVKNSLMSPVVAIDKEKKKYLQ